MAKAAVIYWSGTGNTELMAVKIKNGMDKTSTGTEMFKAAKFDVSTVDEYDKLALGCPSMGAEELEDSEFEPMFADIENKLKGKKVALFGSYGWGDGQWMRDWQDRVLKDGALLYDDGLTINGAPDTIGEDICVEYGEGFSRF